MNLNSHNICALIPARYGSSRLNGKPLLVIDGKSIINRTYSQTKKSKYIQEVYVVTDDDRIKEEIEKIGGKCLMVKEECLNGTERICRALDKVDTKYDIIVNVQGDEPFIDPLNIDTNIELYLKHQNNKNMVCATIHYPITDITELNNRAIGKMIMGKNEKVLYASRSMIPHTKSGQPDSKTTYYGHVGVFVFRRSYLKKYLHDENTSAMLAEDIEWLKIIENGYDLVSVSIEYNHEIGVNTLEDYQYLKNKYES